MVEDADQEGLRERGEQAIGELAQALVDNPMFEGALSAALGARGKAQEAQRAALGALHLPSAAEMERLERRIRSLSGRLEAVEETVDRIADEIAGMRRKAKPQAAKPRPQGTKPKAKPKPKG
jgi:chromosome segregation ATPase